MKFFFPIALFFSATANAAHSVPSLDADNYDAMTDGKTVFIKFFAPWCGHCKKMAPDWEKLSKEWEGDEVGLIADVDCTASGKSLCDANGVKGFPTLKYGDPSALEDYTGGRTLPDMIKFAKENLKPVCSPVNLDLCDDDKKKTIEEYMALSADALKAKIEVEEKKLEKAEENFKAEVQGLQDTYQKLSQDRDDAIAEVKAAGLGLLKAVSAAKKKSAVKDEL